MATPVDITGQRFGRLTALRFEYSDKHNKRMWFCKCDCGKHTYASFHSLKTGHVRSCGCLMREECGNRRRKHGLYKDRLYHSFYNIKQRCENPKATAYQSYGGRGIAVRWENWQDFRNWALTHGYKEGLTLDRIDVNGDYSPENCRWITQAEQMRNTRKTRYLTYQGERKPLIEWCEILGLKFGTVATRVTRGWTNPEEILFGRKRGYTNG